MKEGFFVDYSTDVEEVDKCPTLGGRGMSVYDLFRST